MTRIEDKNGNVLETFQPESKQVISEADAYTMYKMMEGVIDFGTGHAIRDRYGIHSPMGGKTGTTNDNTDGWFFGYTPQLLAGSWVGCDDPFLKIRWTSGGNEMALPEFGLFMQKVYADKNLGIDPKAEFQRPAELDNNPIYADQNIAALAQQDPESNSADQGNGNAGDYEGTELLAPVESEFNKGAFKDMNTVQGKDKGGSEEDKNDQKTDKIKADTMKLPDKKDIKIIPPAIKPDDKNKKPVKPPEKKDNDY
jgi:penicillin-binding protein 1A